MLVEDYLRGGFDSRDDYADYKGAVFSDLFKRQRELPFGSKLQNHALNHRLNEEFRKYFPAVDYVPILRDSSTNRYWFNENMLVAHPNGEKRNLAGTVIEIVDAYIKAKMESFNAFIETCERLASLKDDDTEEALEFIRGLPFTRYGRANIRDR